MSYVDSSNIKIFPLSKNRSYTDSNGTVVAENSRSLFEHRIVNIIKQLIDVDGFVISELDTEYFSNESNLGKALDFNLGGYFISLDSNTSQAELGISSTDSGKIWACLKLSTDTSEVNGQDEEDEDEPEKYKYTGVQFILSDIDPADNFHATLLILIKDSQGNCWKVPESSKYKFKSRSFSVTKIDGKH